MTNYHGQPVSIFCAYAPEDERFYQELAAHFRVLSDRSLCTLRHRENIVVGSELVQTLTSFIEEAELVLVLLSSDYFLSPFSTNVVLQDRLARKVEEACLIPVLLRPCSWQVSLFGSLMPLPRDGSPVSSYEPRDTVWLTLIEEIRPRIMHLSHRGTSQETLTSPTREGRKTWTIPYQRNPFFTGRENAYKRSISRDRHAYWLSAAWEA